MDFHTVAWSEIDAPDLKRLFEVEGGRPGDPAVVAPRGSVGQRGAQAASSLREVVRTSLAHDESVSPARALTRRG